MSKEERADLVNRLNLMLELDHHTVGFRFIYSEEEFQACTSRAIDHYLPYCVMVKSAAFGHAIKAKPGNIGCFAAARALGMTEVTESYKSGEDYMAFGMFCDQTASKKVVDNIAICDNNAYAFELAPLEEMEEDPDVVIQVTVPYNAMRLVQGYNYHYGTYSNYRVGGLQAMCSEATAYPYMSGDINITMFCAGTRYLCKWDRSEMAVAMPYGKLADTVDGVFNTINPLERDGDKKRIDQAFHESEYGDIEIHYGQNYDTGYYRFGEKGIV